MGRDEDAETLARLRRQEDLSIVPRETLIRAASLARRDHLYLRQFLGRAAASLHQDGMTWEQIGEAVEMAPMTIYRWAKPYLV